MGADSDADGEDQDVAFCMFKVGLIYELGIGTQKNSKLKNTSKNLLIKDIQKE